jgi:hypothetical protein
MGNTPVKSKAFERINLGILGRTWILADRLRLPCPRPEGLDILIPLSTFTYSKRRVSQDAYLRRYFQQYQDLPWKGTKDRPRVPEMRSGIEDSKRIAGTTLTECL